MAQVRKQVRASLRRLPNHLVMKPQERVLGGQAGSALWIAGGIALSCFPLLPGYRPAHVLVIELLAMSVEFWGVFGVWMCPWNRIHPLICTASSLCAFVVIPVGVALTGGPRSPAWIALYWAVPFGCYFYPRALGLTFVALAVLAQSMPLLYAHDALHDGYLATLILAVIGYVVIGGGVIAGKGVSDRLRLRSETFVAEQVALRRAASAVIRGEDPDSLYAFITAEIASLIDADVAGIFECVDDEHITVVGSWARYDHQRIATGMMLPVVPGAAVAVAIERGAPARSNGLDGQPGTIGYEFGFVSSVVAPVRIGGQTWGVVGLGSNSPKGFNRYDEQRLETFAELLSNIVTSVEERAELEQQALTDQLTGLLNHRALHQRLEAELAGASRHGRQLAVALLDLDNFKEINDAGGHAAGDEALRLVARCLQEVSRGDDTVGRLGGDEFMWILPDTDSHQAMRAIERARELIAGLASGPRRPTTSAGICDTTSTSDPAELVRRADIALYASKAAGRNQVTLYDAAVAAALEPHARSAWMERAHSLAGLRALARAVDAKDPATSEHSERVASFAGRLAQAAGWSDERIARLREAGLVHDVGKLAVPDALLTKPGRLTERERIQINEHVELSVRIVGNILSEEQVSWIRGHHERPDGCGYPDGLMGEDINDGAALLALADAWDVMVVGRTYSRRKSPEEAYAECLELTGVQFMPVAVEALQALRAAGGLDLEDALEGPDEEPRERSLSARGAGER
ncbi:MAG TPA: diguanylate cyclase [Solirubrobacteraceae bacterium]|nr:diguanylate cyclase [Solirubrobacteraceae bacterium]